MNPSNKDTSNMTLRLELFVDHVPTSADFYQRVLGFGAGEQKSEQYTPMTRGHVTLSLNRRAALPDDHPIQAAAGERLGRGVEIVLEVDDVAALYVQVQAQGWPISAPMEQREWGLTDFRIVDPDGYYLRITSRGA